MPSFRPLPWNVVGQRLHVGEPVVGVQHAAVVALPLPAVVDVHVDVAGVPHPGLHHGVGDLADHRVADVQVEAVPAVPAHGGSPGETVVGKRLDLGRLDPLRDGARTREHLLIGRPLHQDPQGRHSARRLGGQLHSPVHDPAREGDLHLAAGHLDRRGEGHRVSLDRPAGDLQIEHVGADRPGQNGAVLAQVEDALHQRSAPRGTFGLLAGRPFDGREGLLGDPLPGQVAASSAGNGHGKDEERQQGSRLHGVLRWRQTSTEPPAVHAPFDPGGVRAPCPAGRGRRAVA